MGPSRPEEGWSLAGAQTLPLRDQEEGGVAGTYLHYSGALDKARQDLQIALDPMYSIGYYEAI